MAEEKYDYISELGSGSFGKAWLVRDLRSSQNLVAKLIKIQGLPSLELDRCVTEIAVLRYCRHVNIVRYVEAFVEDGTLQIVMEYADNGDLQKKIDEQKRMYVDRQKGKYFDKEVILDWFLQVCQALEYLHSKNILHRDIKPQNVFMSTGDVIKLGDFGISKVLCHSQDLASTRIGTPFYISPEICERKTYKGDVPNTFYNSSSDMWAAGCLLYELCMLEVPFQAGNMPELTDAILNCQYMDIPSEFGKTISYFLSGLLRLKPSQRMTARDILREKFVIVLEIVDRNKARNSAFLARSVHRSCSRSPHHEKDVASASSASGMEFLKDSGENKDEKRDTFEVDRIQRRDENRDKVKDKGTQGKDEKLDKTENKKKFRKEEKRDTMEDERTQRKYENRGRLKDKSTPTSNDKRKVDKITDGPKINKVDIVSKETGSAKGPDDNKKVAHVQGPGTNIRTHLYHQYEETDVFYDRNTELVETTLMNSDGRSCKHLADDNCFRYINEGKDPGESKTQHSQFQESREAVGIEVYKQTNLDEGSGKTTGADKTKMIDSNKANVRTKRETFPLKESIARRLSQASPRVSKTTRRQREALSSRDPESLQLQPDNSGLTDGQPAADDDVFLPSGSGKEGLKPSQTDDHTEKESIDDSRGDSRTELQLLEWSTSKSTIERSELIDANQAVLQAMSVICNDKEEAKKILLSFLQHHIGDRRCAELCMSLREIVGNHDYDSMMDIFAPTELAMIPVFAVLMHFT